MQRMRKKPKRENHTVVVPELPFVIICEILSRLPVEDIVRWRCVCRSWRDLPMDPYFMQLQCSRYYDVFETQRYLVSYRDPALLLVSEMNGKWKGLEIPIPKNKSRPWVAVNSYNDLILLCQLLGDKDLLFIVFNSITKERTKLPVLNINNYSDLWGRAFGIGFDQRNSQYKVIYDHLTSPIIITLGQKSWRNLHFPLEIIDKKFLYCTRIRRPVFFDRAFHWVFIFFGAIGYFIKGILKLDICSEKFQTMSFSPSPEMETDESHAILPFKFGNSVALFHHKWGYKSLVIKIWRILGANADGSCYYQFKYFKVPVDRASSLSINASSLNPFNAAAALSCKDFIFATSDNLHNYMFVYDEEKDEFHVAWTGDRVDDECIIFRFL